MVMGDGSVRFIKNSISHYAWGGMATIAGGEIAWRRLVLSRLPRAIVERRLEAIGERLRGDFCVGAPGTCSPVQGAPRSGRAIDRCGMNFHGEIDPEMTHGTSAVRLPSTSVFRASVFNEIDSLDRGAGPGGNGWLWF